MLSSHVEQPHFCKHILLFVYFFGWMMILFGLQRAVQCLFFIFLFFLSPLVGNSQQVTNILYNPAFIVPACGFSNYTTHQANG